MRRELRDKAMFVATTLPVLTVPRAGTKVGVTYIG